MTTKGNHKGEGKDGTGWCIIQLKQATGSGAGRFSRMRRKKDRRKCQGVYEDIQLSTYVLSWIFCTVLALSLLWRARVVK